MSPSKISMIAFDSFYNIIDGSQRSSDQFHHGVNPSNKEELWEAPVGSKQDLEDAIASARKAFPSWSQTPIEKRKKMLLRFAELYSSYEDEFVTLLGKENGKPIGFATTEVQSAIHFIHSFVAYDLPEETVEDKEKVVITRYMPLGVVGAICPWNFPLVLSAAKIAPAVMTGNCIIVKPSPFTPYTSLKLVELAQEIFPPGVIQAIGGNDEIGAWLTNHPLIDKISFTGSIPTGKKVMEASARTLKRVTLELGGNDASIILPDVDIKKVAPEVVMGAFQNSGQVCVATKRIYIHEDIYRPFMDEMVRVTKKLKVGSFDEDGVMLGPVQNVMQYEKVKGYFEDSKANGYAFAAGLPEVSPSKGFFVQPTIIDNPPNESRIITEEPFGPIVPTQPWSDEEEVIARANNTNTGLGACVWGKDLVRAQRIGRQLQAGSVFINSWEKPNPHAFFSGHKESGIGGEFGPKGLLAYCNAHVMHVFK